MTEEDIKRLFITKAITKAGWADDQIKMEYYFTDGRVIFEGNTHDRQARKRADYVLFDRNNYPIAIIEAKDNKKPVGGGMQQAKEYAEILDIKFAYSSNGDAFLEHDFLTCSEKEIPLEKFTKQYFVVTFVALLVLVRHQHIMLEQDIMNDEEIYIIKRSFIENEEVLRDER